MQVLAFSCLKAGAKVPTLDYADFEPSGLRHRGKKISDKRLKMTKKFNR